MNTNIIVVDDFYSNPDAVRELALESELFEKGDLSENFAGQESLYNFFNKGLVTKFENIIGKNIVVDENRNAFGRFRFAQTQDQRKTQIHFDDKDWSAIVYLSNLHDSRSGTIFTEHKRTRLIGPPQTKIELRKYECESITEFDRRYVLPDTLNLSAWNIHLRVPFKYNRLVLFRGKELFHGSEALFGHDRITARLTQNFFFNEA